MSPLFPFRLLVPIFCTFAVFAQNDAVSVAMEARDRGDLPTAEETLRSDLKLHPADVAALAVLGVVLDQERKYAEAEDAYRRATALDPRSASLLNNYGNHLIATGRPKEAQAAFLKVLALNPRQTNAMVQLARLALEQKSSARAMEYLDRLAPDARQNPDVAVLVMQAEYAVGRDKDADVILARLSSASTPGPARLAGALASVGRYDKAEALYSRALEASPGDFEILYHLGLAAAHAGDQERAREVLQAALDQQPHNVDVLYDLAAVDAALNRNDAALQLLAEAARLDPGRPDVQQLLARTTSRLGYFGDAIDAWGRYLALVPGDEAARRERAFDETAAGDDAANAMAELRSFVRKHPRDAAGHYELGVALNAANPAEALEQFSRAVALRPDLTAAYVGRALVNYRQGKLAEALPDLELAARREPNNAAVLDRLGQIYLALERAGDAVPLLRKAAELAPGDAKTLMHLGRALVDSGHEQESKEVFARFRQLGSDASATPHPAGLVEFLSLSPEEQLARYRAGVERTVRNNPANAEAQERLLELQLSDGHTSEAAETARRLIALKPDLTLMEKAGAALLASSQYEPAEEFLEKAVAAAGPSADLVLDLAIAMFHTGNAAAAMEQMNRIAPANRSGDYYLARAQMLAGAGRNEDAAAALNQALEESPRRPDLYRDAAALLLRNRQFSEVLPLLERGIRVLPNDPELLLLRAGALELSGHTEQAGRGLRAIENRWPEWAKAWITGAIVADLHGQESQARRMSDAASLLDPKNEAVHDVSDKIGRHQLSEASLQALLTQP